MLLRSPFYLIFTIHAPCDSSAIHIPTQRKVAIKRITPFDHSMFCLRTLREIKLLRHFDHENIISILDILRPPSLNEFREVYLVQVGCDHFQDMRFMNAKYSLSDCPGTHGDGYASSDTHPGSERRSLPVLHLPGVSCGIPLLWVLTLSPPKTLRALKALHSADVLHRDLKPSNLLLNANCDLKVRFRLFRISRKIFTFIYFVFGANSH